MKKHWYTIFCAVLFAEAAFLAFACVLCIYYLLCELTITNIDTLSMMVKLTLAIDIALVLESALYKYLIKRKEAISYDSILDMPEKEKIHRYLQIIQNVFGLLWFLHGFVFTWIVEGRMNLKRGTDLYMLWGKPGTIIILLSLVGVVFSDIILYGIYKKNR